MNSGLSMDQMFIEKLTGILEVNLEKEHFGVKEFANEAGLSRSKLHRKLKKITGKSASKFIREFRLQKAMVMLQNNVATVSEIAYKVGFGSPTYFNTCFNNYYGFTPGEVKFRNSNALEIKKKSDTLDLINSAQRTFKKLTIKQRILTNKLALVNTFLIILLSVIGYSLYNNYNNHISEDIVSIDNIEKSIAILPFKNLSEEKDDEFFAMGITKSLQNRLNAIKYLKVISGNSMEKYSNTKMTASEITKEIGVKYLLEGSVQRYRDTIKVVIHFIDARKNHQLSSMVFFEEFKNLFALQRNIANNVVEHLNIKLSEEELIEFDKKPTNNLQAYNLYLKGRFFWHRRTEEDLLKSIDYFNRAIKLDSTFALAYSGLADTYYAMPWLSDIKDVYSWFNLSKKYIEKTLSIDNNIAEVHATLGTIYCFMDWNWEAAEEELKLAIKLNPNYATAHQYYAELLEILGRAEEARNEIDLALSLNPNSFMMTHISARLFYQEGQYEKALIESNKSKEFNKFDPGIYKFNTYIYSKLNMDEEAFAEWEKSNRLDLNPNLELIKGMRNAFKTSGLKGALKFETEAMLNSGQSEKYAFDIASNFAYLGEIEKALDWLETTYNTNKIILVKIKCEHQFKILRSEPRFLALLEKMNLGGYE